MSDRLQRISTALVERGLDQRQLIEVLQFRGYTVLTRGQSIIQITNDRGFELFREGKTFLSFWHQLSMSTRQMILDHLQRHRKPLVGALCFLPFPDKRQHQSNPASTS